MPLQIENESQFVDTLANRDILIKKVTLSEPLTSSNGGTGLTAFTPNSLFYGANSSTFGQLAIGTQGQILTIDSNNTPLWANITSSDSSIEISNTNSITLSSALQNAISSNATNITNLQTTTTNHNNDITALQTTTTNNGNAITH